jgi:hypothetical protein
VRDLVPKEILTSDLSDHPAVRAWSEVAVEFSEPPEIQTLKRSKSAVYRLVGAGPNASGVIAKRCRAATALNEFAIYQQVLPRLPLAFLECYGMLEDQDPDYRWLFIEDAGTQPYRPEHPEHRTLFAQWLAVVHTAGQEIESASCLPARGTDHFLEHLRLARARIESNLNNPALTADDFIWLRQIITQLEFLESRWDRVENFCEGMPRTLVHCDTKKKNLRVRQTESGLSLLAFDWEKAGWGCPGTDVMQCGDLDEYRSIVVRKWPAVDSVELERLFNIGVVFRMLAEIHWETSHLKYEWMERPRLSLPARNQRLTEAMHAVNIH